MTIIIRSTKLLLLVSLLFGCASSSMTPPEPMSRYLLDVIDTQVNIVSDDKTIIAFNVSSLGGGPTMASGYSPAGTSASGQLANAGAGIIASLIVNTALSIADKSINNARERKADQLLMPLRNSLGDFSFRSAFREHLTNRLNTVPIKLLGDLLESNTDSGETVSDSSRRVQTLNITTSHFLTKDASRLMVITNVGLYYPGTEQPVSAQNFFYLSETVGGDGDPEKAIDRWSERDAERYKQVSKEATESIVEMIGRAMTRDVKVADPGLARNVRINAPGTGLHKQKYSGIMIEETDNRVVFLSNIGNLFLFPANVLEY